jgi:hypothetical protein
MTDERPFTVRDRRSFTADGELRPDAAEPADAPPPPAAEPAEPAADLPSGEASLEALFADLAAAVAFHLGLMGESETDAPKVDLAAARHAISMLELLQVKTQGNRTPREDQVLERLLFEMRMAWMARARGGAA